MSENPFDKLTYATLLFLAERTDFSEPFFGFGLATEIKDAIKKAYEKKLGEREEFLARGKNRIALCVPTDTLFQAKK